jgi:NitT/TauT family transport system substrate-binding protein
MLRPPRWFALAALVFAVGCHGKRVAAGGGTVRLGFFPNITHAPALIALEQGNFTRALAPFTVEPKAFNAGPEAMEALFAGALDAVYVGPAPAINAYLRSKGEVLVVVAGAAQDGAGLVVRPGANIKSANDLRGKKLATPQLANTQDIALRIYLRDQNLKTTDKGGDVQVMPLANADSFALFQRGQLDGAWVPEPWLSRLCDQAGGQLFLDERERWPSKHFPTTILVVTKKLAREKPELVQKLVSAHAATIAWIAAHDDEARALADTALQKWAKQKLPPEVLKHAWTRVRFAAQLMPDALAKQLSDGRALGLLPSDGDLGGFVDGHFLAGVAGAP